MFTIFQGSLIQDLAAVLYLLLAFAVTIDVLLKKSDVRAALGWIGIAWFSPLIGAFLYYMFGINRVTRRALKMSRLDTSQIGQPASATIADAPPHIRELFETSERTAGGALTAGNDLAILQSGDTAYPQMLAAITNARHSIALTSYIFRNDAAGHAFADALIAAHRRGVTVRVLLDSVGIGYIFPQILLYLKAGGVRADRFLHTWLPWRMPFLNMRNHRKLLVVDGNVAFLGGMNIGAENSRRLSARNFINDIHFRVEGPVVAVVMDAFARDWTFTTDESLDDDVWWPTLQPAGPVFARGLRSGPDADIYKLEMILGAALAIAKKRIRIVTPYFLPDARLQFAIAQACLRGVEVDIIIPKQCNYFFVDWAMRAHFRFFRHIAANIVLTPLPFDHSKLVTMDGSWCLIGSSNWDTRSFRLNFEFDLECYDPELVQKLDEIIDAKVAGGQRLTARDLAQPTWIRVRDAAARLLMPYL
jgi:cardiolipin synthase